MTDTLRKIEVEPLRSELETVRGLALAAQGQTAGAQAAEQVEAVLERLAGAPVLSEDWDDEEMEDGGWQGLRWQDDDGIETVTAWVEAGPASCLVMGSREGGRFEIALALAGDRGVMRTATPDGALLIPMQGEEIYGEAKRAWDERLDAAREEALRELKRPPDDEDWLCPNCGWPNEASAALCTECRRPRLGGARAPETQEPVPETPSQAEEVKELSVEFLRGVAEEIRDELFEELARKGYRVASETVRKPEPERAEHGCVSCEETIPADARFCPHCGEPQLKACPDCGTANHVENRFCTHCGSSLA